ncbi:unnamed protein product, partial [Rotaria sp. Silwood1]
GTDNDLGFRIIGRVNVDIGCWVSGIFVCINGC